MAQCAYTHAPGRHFTQLGVGVRLRPQHGRGDRYTRGRSHPPGLLRPRILRKY